MKKMKTGVSILLAVLLVCATANAYLIQIGVEGIVTGGAGLNIHVGDAITGYYTYESTTLDSDPEPTGGLYLNYGLPYGISLSIGGFTFQTNPNNVDIGIINEPGWDGYSVSSEYLLPLSNGTTVNVVYWHLNNDTGTALDSDLLPLTLPVLSKWNDNSLYINCGPRESDSVVIGEITDVYLIPEPATILLILVGAVLIRKKTAGLSIR